MINVLFCGDRGVEKGILLSALSLCKHCSEPLSFYLLTASVGERRAISPDFAKAMEKALVKKRAGCRVMLRDLTKEFSSYLPTANLNTRFTPLCMLRLFADLVPDLPRKLLYLDGDVLCRGDLAPLWQTQLSSWEIAGVPDRYGKWFFSRPFRHDYVNSGVLLLDLAAIRESGLFFRCRELCRDKKMFMPDQTALNKLAKKKLLPARYNTQGGIRRDTVLAHFTTFFRLFPLPRAVTVKPWDKRKVHQELKIFEFDDILEELNEFYERKE